MGCSGSVQAWPKILKHPAPVKQCKFSPSDHRLVALCQDNRLRIWDGELCAPHATFEGHTDVISGGNFDGSGSRFATCSADETVRVWQVDTKDVIAQLPHQSPVLSVQFSPDSALLCTAMHHTMILWDANAFNKSRNEPARTFESCTSMLY